MNKLPANATSPAKAPVLTDAWITRLFSRLEGLYGARFHDLWKGTYPENVKATWAEKLGGFSDKPAVLKAALDACDENPWPPNLPEFLELCRAAVRRQGSYVALPPPVPLDRETAARRVAELGIRRDQYAPSTDWAKRLRKSYLAGDRLLPIQIEMASEALNENWAFGKIEITGREAA